jgi:quercetin dioxygenase-like cupin family protein
MTTTTPDFAALAASGGVASAGTPRWHAGHLFEFLATRETTGGAFALLRVTCRPGFDPPLHVHRREDELWHIIEGEATFQIGDALHTAGPGDTVWTPRNVPHAPRFDTDVRMLVLITPGGGERLFEEFSVPAQQPTLPPLGEFLPDYEAMGRRMAELGIEILGPPLSMA